MTRNQFLKEKSMKNVIIALGLATLVTSQLASAAYANLPGAYYQQQRSGYPQSPPSGS